MEAVCQRAIGVGCVVCQFSQFQKLSERVAITFFHRSRPCKFTQEAIEQNRNNGDLESTMRSGFSKLRPIKPSSVKTDAQRSFAIEENESEKQAALERMAKQRLTRLSAGDLVRMKNHPS